MRVAIVTGAGSGIGKALAGALVRRGDTVLVADLNAASAGATAEELTARGPGKAIAAALDVTDADAVGDLVAATEKAHGALDLMVNNAGIAVGGATDELTLEHWNRAIDVNLRGVVHGVHAAYPRMKRRGSGQILNTASLAGLVPGPMSGPYSATKYAVVGMTLGLRAEARRYGVKVSVLCPGIIDTPIFENINPGLPQTAVGARSRELFVKLAKVLQGGRFYPAEALAADALRGLDRNTAVIVAPRGARVAWLANRYSPARLTELATRATEKWWS